MITAGRSVESVARKSCCVNNSSRCLIKTSKCVPGCGGVFRTLFRRRDLHLHLLVDPEKNFFSACIDRCRNFSFAVRQRSECFQHRYICNRLVQCFRQAFDRAQPHAQPGKRSRPRSSSKPAEIFYSVSMFLQQSGERGNQLRGESPAGNRRRLNHAEISCVRFGQRDAAGLARCVDGENEHLFFALIPSGAREPYRFYADSELAEGREPL